MNVNLVKKNLMIFKDRKLRNYEPKKKELIFFFKENKVMRVEKKMRRARKDEEIFNIYLDCTKKGNKNCQLYQNKRKMRSVVGIIIFQYLVIVPNKVPKL